MCPSLNCGSPFPSQDRNIGYGSTGDCLHIVFVQTSYQGAATCSLLDVMLRTSIFWIQYLRHPSLSQEIDSVTNKENDKQKSRVCGSMMHHVDFI